MKKLFVVFGMVGVLQSLIWAEIKHINSIAEFEALTKKGNVIIDFYASWCLPCSELSYNLKKLKTDNDFVRVYKINIDENKDLQVLYGEPQIPTLLYIKDGKVIDKYIGSRTTSQLEEDISHYFD